MKKNKLLTLYAVLVFAFLMLPLVIISITAFGTGPTIVFPIEGFTMDWFIKVFESDSFVSSFLSSVKISLLATFLALLVGVPSAYALAKSKMWGRNLLKSFFLSPTIVPGIVIGFVLFQFFVLSLNIDLSIALLTGHFLVTLPYVIRVVGSTLDQFDFSVEEAAWSLGCSKVPAFFKVVLPNITSGISAAFMLGFINSFNNIPVSMFLTGPGMTTFPATLMSYIEYNYDPTVSAISVILMSLTLIMMIIVDRTLGIASLTK